MAVAKTNLSLMILLPSSLEQIREAYFDLDDALYNEESRILEYGSPICDYYAHHLIKGSAGDRFRNGIRRLTLINEFKRRKAAKIFKVINSIKNK